VGWAGGDGGQGWYGRDEEEVRRRRFDGWWINGGGVRVRVIWVSQRR
jgi:hypothetical protein